MVRFQRPKKAIGSLGGAEPSTFAASAGCALPRGAALPVSPDENGAGGLSAAGAVRDSRLGMTPQVRCHSRERRVM
jgi:hypothetical protein